MSKLILTHEVTGLGAPGDVVDVKNGFARNYLIPQGFAVQWTRGGEKQIDSIKAARTGSRARNARRSTGPEGQAAGDCGDAARSRPARADACSAPSRRPMSLTRLRPPVSARSTSARSRSPSPIKSTGEHEATVRLRDDIVATITLKVVAAK